MKNIKKNCAPYSLMNNNNNNCTLPSDHGVQYNIAQTMPLEISY